MRPNTLSRSLLYPGVLLALASCDSTDILPSASVEKGNKVTLSVTAPEVYTFNPSSRAEDPYQLRLTARLYPLDENGKAAPDAEPIATTETIHSGTTTTLMFEIDNQGDYCVTIFADYIPAGSAAVEGHYPDLYYDTTVPGKITAKAAGEDISDFFNNDLRDCFIGKLAFKKEINIFTDNVTLTRPVSKVLLSAPADPVEQLLQSIDVTVCSHLSGYTFAIDNTPTVGIPSADAVDPLEGYSKVRVEPNGTELLYFYTFAGEHSDADRPALGEISFSLNPRENIKLENDTRSIAEGLLQPAINYRLSVKGGKGWISAEAGAEDIIVNISLEDTWKSPTVITQ